MIYWDHFKSVKDRHKEGCKLTIGWTFYICKFRRLKCVIMGKNSSLCNNEILTGNNNGIIGDYTLYSIIGNNEIWCAPGRRTLNIFILDSCVLVRREDSIRICQQQSQDISYGRGYLSLMWLWLPFARRLGQNKMRQPFTNYWRLMQSLTRSD